MKLQPRDHLLYFPTAAWQTPGGKEWQAEIHAWVYRVHKKRPVRKALMRGVLKVLGISKGSSAAALFEKNSAFFLVHGKRGRTVTLRVAGKRMRLKPSDRSGHIHDGVRFPTGPARVSEKARVLSLAPGNRVWLIPPKGVSVLSDIDDTIKVSRVGKTREVVAHALVRPYRAVPGMAALYRQWSRKGAAFHYVSASPWPLYPALDEFMRAQGFPAGPVLLKHFRLKSRSFFSLFKEAGRHKLPLLREIVQHYPERDFILLGDSGERDPEIYGDLAREFPSQVSLIAIRQLDSKKREKVRYRKAFQGVDTKRVCLFRDPKELQGKYL